MKHYKKPFTYTIIRSVLNDVFEASILQYAGGNFNATIEAYSGSLPGLESENLASGRLDIAGSQVTFHWSQDPPFPPEFVISGSIHGNTINIPGTSLSNFSISGDSFGGCVFENGSLQGSCTFVNENTLECILDVSGSVQQHTEGNYCNAIGGANLHFELTLTRQ